MSVMIVTSLGDIVVDLYTDRCPLTAKNFLKLCKMKYYNGCLFHTVEKGFMAQTGDRTGTGKGGDSVYRFLYGDQARFFDDEIHHDLKHSKIGTVAMAGAGENCNASQFYITLRDDIEYLDGKHTVFGIVEEKESLDCLEKISEAYVDAKGRPFKDIRIKHAYILDDPFDDPSQLAEFIPEKSPEGKPPEEEAEERLEDSWVPMDEILSTGELEEVIRSKGAHTNAAILESIGDIPDAEIKPPDTVLFVCKLNPVTQDEDLYTIFSRFGTVTSADIIRDYKTGDSLCYAFIEFESKDACENAYFKMDNTLIDDRRIRVDFSQSVAKLWRNFRHAKNSTRDGCFKCGSSDHIARDCMNGQDEKVEGPKYVLKDADNQRGENDPKSYEMLFDEESIEETEQKHTKKLKTEHHKVDRLKHQHYEHIKRRGEGDVDREKSKERDERRHGYRPVEKRIDEGDYYNKAGDNRDRRDRRYEVDHKKAGDNRDRRDQHYQGDHKKAGDNRDRQDRHYDENCKNGDKDNRFHERRRNRDREEDFYRERKHKDGRR